MTSVEARTLMQNHKCTFKSHEKLHISLKNDKSGPIWGIQIYMLRQKIKKMESD